MSSARTKMMLGFCGEAAANRLTGAIARIASTALKKEIWFIGSKKGNLHSSAHWGHELKQGCFGATASRTAAALCRFRMGGGIPKAADDCRSPRPRGTSNASG